MGYTTIDLMEAELKLSSGSINSTSAPTDTQVYSWIAQAEDKINDKTGNLYSQELVSSQVLDWEGNDNLIRLPKFVSISELRYNDQNAGETESWTTKTENTDFYAHGDSGEVEIITTKFSPLTGRRRFMITYFKGSSKVPNRIKQLATEIVANRVVSATLNNQAAEQSGGSVQVGTIKIEDPTAFSVSAYRAREASIKDFFDNDIGTFRAFRIDRAYDL